MSSRPRSSFRARSDHGREKPQSSSYFTKSSSSSSSSKDYRDRTNSYSSSYNEPKPIPKITPNFKPSGLLAKESNNIKGVQLKYVAPDDAITSTVELTKSYYIYIYNNADSEPIQVNLNTRTSHLIGRDTKVCDIATSEESVSKQHAVIQFRDVKGEVRPYVIDLDSSNGTFLNKGEIPQGRFVELLNSDVLNFGDGDIDYVLIISKS